MNSDIPIFLFAKKPVAGRVKTRLQSHCSPAVAATIAEELIRATVELVVANWDGQVRLCVWPDTEHSVFEEMRTTHSVSIDVQAAGVTSPAAPPRNRKARPTLIEGVS